MMGIPQQFPRFQQKNPVCKERLAILVMSGRSESKHADNEEAGIGSKIRDLFFPDVII